MAIQPALGILEVNGFTPGIVALDAMEKAAGIRVLQAELNDFLGVVLKIQGPVDSVRTAIDVGHRIADQMHGGPRSTVLPRPDERAWPALESRVEFNPLIQQDVVHLPRTSNSPEQPSEGAAVANPSFALGFIETQGFTAVFEAIDTACKAANVEVLGKEKLGGGFVTVVIKGDVAAVNSAIESGKAKVEGLGKLIAAHVIPRPSESVMALLPK
ncbi:MAG: BMC domain-containing protein [Planctomycetales bacterium]|nr:BMC domain-containing protein [Planctomycetales bacterium]MCA9219086.1 BMC domain-containing protein [Planctomycetales bacterium]